MGRPGLSHHPKFLQLARALGEVVARGVLELMWEVSYESGDERLGASPDAVEAAARWRGERGVCFAALRDSTGQGTVGFIEARAGVWCVHDLWDHAPDYVRKRAVREEQRRTKGRSMAAEQRTLTGQDPVSVQALTPPPAPTRAPSPAPEKKKKLAGSAPADPREGGDATYKALVAALFVLFREHKDGHDYDPSGKDWTALADLRKRHDGSEIIRRWAIGLQARYGARCATFWALRERWNDCAQPEAQGGAQSTQKRPELEVGGGRDKVAEETEVWAAYRENRKAEGLDP